MIFNQLFPTCYIHHPSLHTNTSQIITITATSPYLPAFPIPSSKLPDPRFPKFLRTHPQSPNPTKTSKCAHILKHVTAISNLVPRPNTVYPLTLLLTKIE